MRLQTFIPEQVDARGRKYVAEKMNEAQRLNQLIRELKRQFAGEKLEPEQLKGLIRAGYVYRNGDEHLLTEKGRDALAQLGVHPGVANDPNDVASNSSIDITDEAYLVMNEIESFLDECRADPWFRDRPEFLDRIEEVLTKFYRASDENPEWQAIWDRVCKILEQKNEALVERRKASHGPAAGPAIRPQPGRVSPGVTRRPRAVRSGRPSEGLRVSTSRFRRYREPSGIGTDDAELHGESDRRAGT